MTGRREAWIVVCEHFHGAVGPIPTEELAVDLAVDASQIGACTYRAVRLGSDDGPAPGPADTRTRSTTAASMRRLHVLTC